MARRRGLALVDVIEAAARVADAGGLERLSLAAVAARLRVRPPSLVHHVGSLEGLRRMLAIYGAKALRAAMLEATRGRRGPAALLAAGRAYRAFALRHPGLLAALLPAPRPGEDHELAAALAEPVADLLEILAALGLRGDEAIHVVRALRSYLHGFTDLERRGGFGLPQKVEASFERGLGLLVDGLRSDAG